MKISKIIETSKVYEQMKNYRTQWGQIETFESWGRPAAAPQETTIPARVGEDPTESARGTGLSGLGTRHTDRVAAGGSGAELAGKQGTQKTLTLEVVM